MTELSERRILMKSAEYLEVVRLQAGFFIALPPQNMGKMKASPLEDRSTLPEVTRGTPKTL